MFNVGKSGRFKTADKETITKRRRSEYHDPKEQNQNTRPSIGSTTVHQRATNKGEPNGTDSIISGATSKYKESGGFLQSSFSVGERSVMVAEYSTVEEHGSSSSSKFTANQTIVLASVDEVKNKGTWGMKVQNVRSRLAGGCGLAVSSRIMQRLSILKGT